MGELIVLLIFLGVFGGWGRRMGWWAPSQRDASTRRQIEQLQSQLDQLHDLPERVVELEERLDFAERMLTRERASRLPPTERS